MAKMRAPDRRRRRQLQLQLQFQLHLEPDGASGFPPYIQDPEREERRVQREAGPELHGPHSLEIFAGTRAQPGAVGVC